MLPNIAITLGDPSGIGPEIVEKAVLFPQIYKVCRPIVVGDTGLISVRKIKGKNLPCRFVNLPASNRNKIKIGSISAISAKAAYESIVCAAKLALDKEVQAIVTAPISKEAFNLAGIFYSGHTELLASLADAKNYAMLMAAGKLRAVMVTRHLPINVVSENISTNEIVRVSVLAHGFLKTRLGINNPRIAICALNPHGGEGGMLGEEEIKTIAPAVKILKKKGLKVEGPLPADSAWRKMSSCSDFDLLVTMYHDQTMIPLKCLNPSKIVNATLGLPFVRTSPGHGTAFDIAGKNVADPSAMIEAIRFAANTVPRR